MKTSDINHDIEISGIKFIHKKDTICSENSKCTDLEIFYGIKCTLSFTVSSAPILTAVLAQ